MKIYPPRTFALLGATFLFGTVGLNVSSQAALIAADAFDYSGTTLNGQDGGTGWNGAYFATGAAASVMLSDDGVSLAYPTSFEPPATTPATSGSRIRTGAGVDTNTSRLLAQTIDLGVDGTTRYVSGLFRKNTANGSGVTNADNVLIEFRDSAGNRRWGFGIEGAADKPWLNANASGTTPGPTVVPGETYFLVAKIVSSASSPDQAFLKVFGTGYGTQVPLAEPTTWDLTLSTSTAANLDRIRIRVDGGNPSTAPGEIDEIRIADTWLDVIGVPEPSSTTLLIIGGMAGLIWRRRGI
jgi:hypothetical protein